MKFVKIYSLFLLLFCFVQSDLFASSHREAPLIANDPLADNTDLYAFRSPDDPSTVTIIANYIPGQLPHGGPNYYTFGENIRYEIHIDNDVNTMGDDVIYRATFTQNNGDPTTFFNIRLGAENLQTTYLLERSIDGGNTFEAIVTDGVVPPNNIGPRSIQSGVGLGAYSHERLIQNALTTATTGETVYCGPAEDPFFVDLAGVFDLGDLPSQDGTSRDGLECYNVHSIAIKVPISILQKEGKDVSEATDILDSDFVIGVWASASRPAIRTLNADIGTESYSGDWVQVSRLGMPLTNEAVVPIGAKDAWNANTPYNEDPAHFEYFYNPELGLYMDDAQFGGAVPAFSPLRIQKSSLAGLFGPTFPGFDFSNGADGLFGLKGSAAVAGTALDDAVFGTLLLPAAGKPRSVDLWPAFHTGVPNFPPYQLATGKMGNPLNAGKPFINNFLPNGGDMLRLNMAVPPTPRASAAFSSLGLINAAVLGLTDPTYANTNIEFIPNMDGFPNGRRLEDDVTLIELQAVAGAVLAAVGLWYDDYDATDAAASPVTDDLVGVLSYRTGVDENDQPFRCEFPYVAAPYSGTGPCSGQVAKTLENNDCTDFQLWTDFVCNPEGTLFRVLLNVSGGTGPYTVLVDGDEELTLEDGVFPYIVGPYPVGGSFSITITDATGCESSEEISMVDCTTTAVELIKFYGTAETNGNLLSWATATEVDSKFFILQHSLDGVNFRNIANVNSSGNSGTRQNYSHLDKSAPEGLSYYRLIEVSTDGRQRVYGVISLERAEGNTFGIVDIYPIPTKSELTIDFASSVNDQVLLEIYDVVGKKIVSQVQQAKIGTNTFQVDLSNAPNGSLILNLIQGEKIVSTQLIKL